ncbi:MAG: FtsH protease activity modulator HflK [Rickettsiaceae bacterium H1]|nr:FtsH protease activity modulator HflK [Rickettsiaceae bacterium H1]
MINDNNPWGEGPQNKRKEKSNIDELVKKLYNDFSFFHGKQFNFNKKSIMVILLVLTLVWMLMGFYIVQPDESGVELVFGKYSNTTGPGLNYNFPAPVGKTFKVKTSTVHKEEIGFKPVVGRGGSGVMLTGDENIVNISFEVQWRVHDPYKYLFNLRDNFGNTIKSASESAMRESIGQNSINFIMVGEGRSKVSAETHDLLQKILDGYGMGIKILSVQLIKVDPPEKVIDAFRDVQSAKADKEREVNQAQAYYNDKIPKSRGEANQKIKIAEAYKQEVINNAEGEASMFKAIYDQYKNDKNITRARLYLETLESILQNLDKMIIDKNSNLLPYLPLNDLLKKKS